MTAKHTVASLAAQVAALEAQVAGLSAKLEALGAKPAARNAKPVAQHLWAIQHKASQKIGEKRFPAEYSARFYIRTALKDKELRDYMVIQVQ